MTPHHLHKHLENEAWQADFPGYPKPTILVTTICYQDDCYDPSGPCLNREMYPPEKIGPKLPVAVTTSRVVG